MKDLQFESAALTMDHDSDRVQPSDDDTPNVPPVNGCHLVIEQCRLIVSNLQDSVLDKVFPGTKHCRSYWAQEPTTPPRLPDQLQENIPPTPRDTITALDKQAVAARWKSIIKGSNACMKIKRGEG
jgi:hypothetical protein